MDNPDVSQSDARSLSHMMDPDPAGGVEPWSREELGEIFEHQLAAPLQCDLVDVSEPLQTADAAAICTFGELLHHGQPPVGLLEQVKRFAKACRNHPNSPLPDEIATVLYFLSIAAARVKCDRRITQMDDRSLCYSLDWALKQPWLDASSRRVLQDGRDAIGTSGPT